MQNQNVINTFFKLTVKNVKRILIVFVLFVVNLAFFLNHIILIETFFYLTFFLSTILIFLLSLGIPNGKMLGALLFVGSLLIFIPISFLVLFCYTLFDFNFSLLFFFIIKIKSYIILSFLTKSWSLTINEWFLQCFERNNILETLFNKKEWFDLLVQQNPIKNEFILQNKFTSEKLIKNNFFFFEFSNNEDFRNQTIEKVKQYLEEDKKLNLHTNKNSFYYCFFNSPSIKNKFVNDFFFFKNFFQTEMFQKDILQISELQLKLKKDYEFFKFFYKTNQSQFTLPKMYISSSYRMYFINDIIKEGINNLVMECQNTLTYYASISKKWIMKLVE